VGLTSISNKTGFVCCDETLSLVMKHCLLNVAQQLSSS